MDNKENIELKESDESVLKGKEEVERNLKRMKDLKNKKIVKEEEKTEEINKKEEEKTEEINKKEEKEVKDKWRNFNVESYSSLKCSGEKKYKYILRFKYSTNISGYDENYFKYKGIERDINFPLKINKVSNKIRPGSLVTYVKKDDKYNNKIGMVEKTISVPTALEAWQDNKRKPPKLPKKYLLKFLGSYYNENNNIREDKLEAYGIHLRNYGKYEKEKCFDMIPKKIGEKIILDKWTDEDKISEDKYDFDYNSLKDKKLEIVEFIKTHYETIFKGKDKSKDKDKNKDKNKETNFFSPESILIDNKLSKPKSDYRYKITSSNISKFTVKLQSNKKKDVPTTFNIVVYVDLILKRSTSPEARKSMSKYGKIKDNITNIFNNISSTSGCAYHKNEIKKIIRSLKQKGTRKKGILRDITKRQTKNKKIKSNLAGGGGRKRQTRKRMRSLRKTRKL